MSIRQSPLGQQRFHTAVRTILITYGVAAFTYLIPPSTTGDTPLAAGGAVSARSLVVLGLGLQLLMLAARVLIKRHAPDRAAAVQGFLILELVADGMTVLFFALGTLGTIMHSIGSI